MKDLLTASRMNAFLFCQRKHYWSYEVGLRKKTSSDALRFGTAWHLAMDARRNGANIDDAFKAAIADKTTLDELQVATLSGMLAGYYSLYENDYIKIVHPEVEFRYSLAGSRKFEVAGKIDGLCVMEDDSLAFIEYKTAGCDIETDSDYWLRLRGNPQVMQYILASRQLGWDVSHVIYDVTRKPMIRPLASVNVLDENGLKIVNDAEGNRVLKKDGTPKQTADKDKGEVVLSAPESFEQFADRLAADTKERPDFYFARRDVPILEDDLKEFEIQRNVIARQILSCRMSSKKSAKPEHGWPKNVGEMTCKMCDYVGFCLQNTSVNVEQPPAGFTVGEIHTELTV